MTKSTCPTLESLSLLAPSQRFNTIGQRCQDPNPANAAAVADTYNQLVNHCAKALAPRKLAAFLLAKGQGLSYEEIALLHDCSPATVKRDLCEAFYALTTAAKELGLIKSKNNSPTN